MEEEEEEKLDLPDIMDVQELDDNIAVLELEEFLDSKDKMFGEEEEEDNTQLMTTAVDEMFKNSLERKIHGYFIVVCTTVSMIAAHTRPLLQCVFQMIINRETVIETMQPNYLYNQMTHVRNVFNKRGLMLFEFQTKVTDPMQTLTSLLLSKTPTWSNLNWDVLRMVSSRREDAKYRLGDDRSFPKEPLKQEMLYEAEGFILLGLVSKDLESLHYCLQKARPIYGDGVFNILLPAFESALDGSLISSSSSKKKKKRNTNT